MTPTQFREFLELDLLQDDPEVEAAARISLALLDEHDAATRRAGRQLWLEAAEIVDALLEPGNH